MVQSVNNHQLNKHLPNPGMNLGLDLGTNRTQLTLQTVEFFVNLYSYWLFEMNLQFQR